MRPAFAIFAVAAVAQWLLPLAGIWQHERVISRGTLVRIECAAPDPYDPLRGRYLAVRPQELGQFAPPNMPPLRTVPVWATLEQDDDGLSRIKSLSLEPIAGPTVIELLARRSGETNGAPTVMLTWPFDRFYLNERLAPEADKLVAERFRDGKRTVAEVRLLDGRAVLTDVLLDGVSIRDVVKQQPK
jgi:hypothetical protein